MAYMIIHCDYCGQSWEVYGSRDWNKNKNRECPHCQHKIDRQTWKNEILPAFGSFSDVNRELFKDHTGNHTPLFTIDFVSDHVFRKVREPHEVLDDLDLFDLDGLERDHDDLEKKLDDLDLHLDDLDAFNLDILDD